MAFVRYVYCGSYGTNWFFTWKKNVYVCMWHVCMYACMYVCVCVCMCKHLWKKSSFHRVMKPDFPRCWGHCTSVKGVYSIFSPRSIVPCIHFAVCGPLHVSVCLSSFWYTRICTNVCANKCMHTCVYIRMRVCTHKHCMIIHVAIPRKMIFIVFCLLRKMIFYRFFVYFSLLTKWPK